MNKSTRRRNASREKHHASRSKETTAMRVRGSLTPASPAQPACHPGCPGRRLSDAVVKLDAGAVRRLVAPWLGRLRHRVMFSFRRYIEWDAVGDV
jgi:hypothetical protein